ncbi:uncharacterized protein LOC129589626 [Paramacrobiotus metropolitanus]|uniref:uncharacterized protein LOC129589626 n=1 Tax=Paramacrobiotus metropolitanus TaxID=2943436 RepID=UPI002445B5F3|nr:uncharacterized protein LOC129589626 [Paramacrobiotus metropolitanus]
MEEKTCNCILYIIVVVSFLAFAKAVSDESEGVGITEDIFYIPINTSDPNVIAGTGPRLWPNRTAIPFYLSSEFDQSERKKVLKALALMERQTEECIIFRTWSGETDYLYFRPRNDGLCGAFTGQRGGPQAIDLGRFNESAKYSCFTITDIQRYTMRSIGFEHEYRRPDRDEHIDMRKGNLMNNEDYPTLFSIDATMYTFGLKYDYHSILHLGALAGSKTNEHPTMVPKKGLIVRMGQNVPLSPSDVARIMIGYKCPLNIRPGKKEANVEENFINFSMERMTDDECAAQFNRYCQPDVTTIDNCNERNDYRIGCRSTASVAVLERMALDMAGPPLRPVSIHVEEQLLSTYSFTPVQGQVVKLQLSNCTTDRVTSRLIKLNYTNLLHFELYHCFNLTIEKADFKTSQQLGMILFYNTTIVDMQPGTFSDLPNLQILSLEALLESQKNYNFDPNFRNSLHDLHCGCKFAWFRSWWRGSHNLRLRAEVGQVYSFEAPYSDRRLENSEVAKEDLYHPVNCRADPFPLGPEWINYYAQIEYSVNEPNCINAVANATANGLISKPTLQPNILGRR